MPRHNLEFARPSLSRGLARQAVDHAQRDSADATALFDATRGMAPNLRSRQRCAARLRRARGVIRAAATRHGMQMVFRTALEVDLRKEGVSCFSETRIDWTWVHVVRDRRQTLFQLCSIHVAPHALERRVERSDCPLEDLLPQMDAAMLRALDRLCRGAVLEDRDDHFLPAKAGVWAGGYELTAPDPAWGPAFADAAPMPVFSIRTYLGEEQMRPTVWYGWSGSRAAPAAA